MTSQNYKNHRRFHPIYHYFLTLLLLAILIGVAALLIREGLSLSSIVILLIFVYITVSFFLMRSYPLKAQDRAIKAEENLRHYVMTGQLLNSRLTFNQIAALRFASDAEFPELCQKAASQNLSSNDIKKAIKNWKGDIDRV
ncbi:hypothetical protein SAMN04487897_12053 [Paenibacillus sp. yr247]|uniref:DUF6526 family protein n=1 Tax=Paenibacillus sp. yr247 TaxID=1761880 RepID=UPI0008921625|nr:DUF6526 family protein [Paenibacillus sp. yr247]SDO71860.1 hypothetical protein SAMN04487897_12053 [Paenibacillus sp. yr247]